MYPYALLLLKSKGLNKIVSVDRTTWDSLRRWPDRPPETSEPKEKRQTEIHQVAAKYNSVVLLGRGPKLCGRTVQRERGYPTGHSCGQKWCKNKLKTRWSFFSDNVPFFFSFLLLKDTSSATHTRCHQYLVLPTHSPCRPPSSRRRESSFLALFSVRQRKSHLQGMQTSKGGSVAGKKKCQPNPFALLEMAILSVVHISYRASAISL